MLLKSSFVYKGNDVIFKKIILNEKRKWKDSPQIRRKYCKLYDQQGINFQNIQTIHAAQ